MPAISVPWPGGGPTPAVLVMPLADTFLSLLDGFLNNGSLAAGPDLRRKPEEKDRQNWAATAPLSATGAPFPVPNRGFDIPQVGSDQNSISESRTAVTPSNASGLSNSPPDQGAPIPDSRPGAETIKAAAELAFAARLLPFGSSPVSATPPGAPSGIEREAPARTAPQSPPAPDNKPAGEPPMDARPPSPSPIPSTGQAGLGPSGEWNSRDDHAAHQDRDVQRSLLAEAKAIPAAPLPSSQDPHTPASPRPSAPVAIQRAEPEAPPAQAASHDVSLRLVDGQSRVDVRLSERAGEVRVLVHTPDRELAASLRSELPDLVGKLRQGGFQAETWQPASAARTDHGQPDGSGAFSGSPQQHPGAGQRDHRQPEQEPARWTEEWNSSLEPGQESII